MQKAIGGFFKEKNQKQNKKIKMGDSVKTGLKWEKKKKDGKKKNIKAVLRMSKIACGGLKKKKKNKKNAGEKMQEGWKK